MDDYFLDPIIGLIPEPGDALTSIFTLPFFLYVALGKVRSIPLALAITFNFLLDTLIGMIPFMIGNVMDFFFKSNKKNLKLITNYVEGDKATINEVNKKAFGMSFLIIVLCMLIYFMGKLVSKIIVWIYGLI